MAYPATPQGLQAVPWNPRGNLAVPVLRRSPRDLTPVSGHNNGGHSLGHGSGFKDFFALFLPFWRN